MIKFMAILFIVLGHSAAFCAERLFYEGFESGSLANVTASKGVTINQNEHSSGNCSARVQFGPEEGNQAIAKRITAGISNEIYVKYYIKLDADYWQGDEGFKPFRANRNFGSSAPAIELWSGGCNRVISGNITTADGVYQHQYGTPYHASAPSIAPYWFGNWTKIEVYIKKNTKIGVSDGIYKIWWNGVQIYSNTATQHLTLKNEFYDTFYFPSNMNCDKWRLSACCNWDKVTPFFAYIDDVEIWNGMPDSRITTALEIKAPTGLNAK